jgi:LacI family transcriptional regulator
VEKHIAVSLKQIAEQCGVTEATVSMALRDNPRISEDRRKQVKKIAKDLGYIPNVLARGLKGGRTRSIGVIWSLDGGHFSTSMLRMLNERIRNHNLVSYFADAIGDTSAIKSVLSDYAARSVDAVIIDMGTHLYIDDEMYDELQHFPFSLIISTVEQPYDVDQIVWDRLLAYRKVADHFADNKRKNPVIVAPMAISEKKAEVFLEELTLKGYDVSRENIIDIPKIRDLSDAECTWRTLTKMYPSANFPFDAAMCSNDDIATTLMTWLKKNGHVVPDNVAVVGFDDNPVSAHLETPLASVERRIVELSDAVEEIVFARIAGNEMPVQKIDLPMTFIKRESAG